MSGTLVASGLSKIGRPELAQIPVPEATSTHKPVPHHTIVEALVETLSFRQIGVVPRYVRGRERSSASSLH